MCASDSRFIVRGRHVLMTCALGLLAVVAHAEPDKDAEQLKRLKLQVRQAQQQQQQAQEAQATADQARQQAEQSLKAQDSDLQKQRAAASSAQRKAAALDKELGQLKGDIERLKAELVALTEKQQALLASSKVAQEKAAATEARLKQEQEGLGQRLFVCVSDNKTLVNLGRELLTRYEEKGIGEVLSANEPFVQTGRVKLENFKAAYSQRLEAAEVKPVGAAGNAKAP